MRKLEEDEDKENEGKRKDDMRNSFQSLTNSKSRRRKSHNKFEVIKRVSSVEKEREKKNYD